MRRLRRILEAVTLRRVLAALLIGAFAKEIVAVLSWLAETGLELGGVIGLRALAVAALRLILDAALIYLAVRGLAALLARRNRRRGPGLEADGTSPKGGADDRDQAETQ